MVEKEDEEKYKESREGKRGGEDRGGGVGGGREKGKYINGGDVGGR